MMNEKVWKTVGKHLQEIQVKNKKLQDKEFMYIIIISGYFSMYITIEGDDMEVHLEQPYVAIRKVLNVIDGYNLDPENVKVIFAHNHPNGSPQTDDDVKTANYLKIVMGLMNLETECIIFTHDSPVINTIMAKSQEELLDIVEELL